MEIKSRAARVDTWSSFPLRHMDRKSFLGPPLASAALPHKLVFVFCLVAAVSCFGKPNGGSNVALPADAGEKPNILFILTDHADLSLFPKMPQIQEQLVGKGTTFPNAFAPFATCCPSRATILRGQYPHNTGVISNYGTHGGVGAFEAAGNDGDNLATRLDNAGYTTGLFGKFLNGYAGGYVPPGWDAWHGWAGPYSSGKIYENGRVNAYDLSRRHEAAILGSKAGSFVRNTKGSPWFAYVAFNSPHNPAYTEPGYADDLRSLHDAPELALEGAVLSARLEALRYCSGKACQDAERKPNLQPPRALHPPWRGLFPAVPRTSTQPGLIPDKALLDTDVGDRGANRHYPGSCIRSSENQRLVECRWVVD